MACSFCGSVGFGISVLPNRCTFCDGTEGGHPPKPLRIKTGEFARYLASYLEHHIDEFVWARGKHQELGFKQGKLAELIQTFQDTLP